METESKETLPSVSETARAEPAPMVAQSTPAPVITPAATPAPPADPLAPEGVFYLLTKASITTDSGIIGLIPGTKLQRIAEGQYTDAEGNKVSVPDSQVTNNLRLAGQLARQDVAAQMALRQRTAPAPAPALALTPAPVAATIDSSSTTPAPVTVAPTEPARTATRSPVSATPNLGSRPTFGSGSVGQLHSSDTHDLKKDAIGWYWADVRGRHHYTSGPGR